MLVIAGPRLLATIVPRGVNSGEQVQGVNEDTLSLMPALTASTFLLDS
jgi:hypothetical protein